MLIFNKTHLFYLLIIFLLSNCKNNSGNEAIGKLIYEKGILENGEPLTGFYNNKTSLKGQFASCARCHRKSGFGSYEGSVYVPPITANILFSNHINDRKDMLRSLFQEEYSPQTWAKIRQLEERPAYTKKSLYELLSHGLNSDGNDNGSTMPRYTLDERNYAHLLAYLKSLDKTNAPGVTSDTIYFAAVITDEVKRESVSCFQEMVDTYVLWKNRNVVAQNIAAKGSEFHRGAFRGTYLNWKIDYWTLSGDSSTWSKQLNEYHKRQPIFALLSGLSTSSWDGIHQYAEQNSIPCVFPNTSLPVTEEDHYNLYLHKGLTQEAEIIANHLHSQSTKTLIITDSFNYNYTRAFMNNLMQRNLDHKFTQISIQEFQSNLKPLDGFVDEIDSLNLVFCLDPENANNIQLPFKHDVTVTIYLPSYLLSISNKDLDRFDKYTAAHYSLPQNASPRNHRIHAWMRSRGIHSKDEILQMNTYFALSVSDFALAHMVGHFSRDYFIERIEHETENNLNPGIYKNVSLGPGQRFASKRCELLRLN